MNANDTPDPSLGPVTATFRLRPGRRRAYLALTLLGLVGGLGGLGAGVWLWFFALRNYGPAVVWRWSGPWLVAGLLLLIPGLLGLLAWLRWRRLRLDIHQHGLRFRHGRWEERMAWSDITALHTQAVRYGLPLRARGAACLRVAARDGREIVIPHLLDRFEQAVDTVKRAVYPLLLAEYSRRFNAGEAIEFGPVRLQAQGINLGDWHVPWPALQAVVVSGGQLTLAATRDGRLHRRAIPTGRIPNVELCVQFLQYLRRRE